MKQIDSCKNCGANDWLHMVKHHYECAYCGTLVNFAKITKVSTINTEGGTFVSGNLKIENGDFVGKTKYVVVVGKNSQGIAVGDNIEQNIIIH